MSFRVWKHFLLLIIRFDLWMMSFFLSKNVIAWLNCIASHHVQLMNVFTRRLCTWSLCPKKNNFWTISAQFISHLSYVLPISVIRTLLPSVVVVSLVQFWIISAFMLTLYVEMFFQSFVVCPCAMVSRIPIHTRKINGKLSLTSVGLESVPTMSRTLTCEIEYVFEIFSDVDTCIVFIVFVYLIDVVCG